MKTRIAISVRGLDFSYGAIQVLNKVDIDFEKGEFTVLLGRNGCGKSTLFSLMAGLEHYKTGSIKILGKERNKLSFAQCAKILGFMPQFHKPVFPFKAEEVVLTGRAAFSGFTPTSSDKRMVGEALEELGISHLAKRPYSELSGGEQQLVMISRVMVQHPPVILLDEPTNHLDVYYQTYVMKCLRRLCDKGMTVIAIMHDPNLALSYADKAYFLKDQKIINPDDAPFESSVALLEYVYSVPFEKVSGGHQTYFLPKTHTL
jgi:iron complex transport system ATP-binding protein